MLTAKQFAVETGISYPVIIEWLKEGKIPEAEQTSFKIWQIPAAVAEVFKKPENRPKLGRPPKQVDADDEAQASVRSAGDQVARTKSAAAHAVKDETIALKPKRQASKKSAKKAKK
jgi:hypothetical protein